MARRASDTFATVTNATLTGRTLDNLLGGVGSGGDLALNWEIFTSGTPLSGNSAGGAIANNALAASIVRNDVIRDFAFDLDPASATSNIRLHAFCGAGAILAGPKIWAQFVNGHTRLQLGEINAGGVSTTRATTNIGAAPAAPVKFEFIGSTYPVVTVRIRNRDTNAVLAEATWTFAAGQPLGNGFGMGPNQGGQAGVYDGVDVGDGVSGAAATLSFASATAAGPYDANGAVTTSLTGGYLFYLVTTTSTKPSVLELMSAGYQAVTAAGVRNIAVSGLAAGTPYWLHTMQVVNGAPSNIATASFTSGAAVVNPLIESVVATPRGDDVLVTITVAAGSGPVSSMSVTLAAHTVTPDGAVTRAGVSATNQGGGVWTAALSNCATGRYAPASATANGPDAGTHTLADTKTLRIIPLTGVAQA